MNKSKSMKYHNMYMDIAKRISEMSHCVRKKAGSVIVKDGNIISMGWNGTPSGMDNCCEVKNVDGTTSTKPIVLHSEANSIIKVAKSNESTEGATLYVTLSPCIECAKLIHQSGITRVIYDELYRSDEGIEFLKLDTKVHIFNIDELEK